MLNTPAESHPMTLPAVPEIEGSASVSEDGYRNIQPVSVKLLDFTTYREEATQRTMKRWFGDKA